MVDKIHDKLMGIGPLAWMAHNPVASNLLMAVLLLGGYLTLPNVKQEVFPEFELDLVLVNVPYPGASPEEVEQGVVLAVEEAVRGIDGVKEVTSTSSEGAGVAVIELLLGADRDRALADVKSAVDRITSFPADAERPIVSLATRQQGVVSLVIYGPTSEKTLRQLAEEARAGLLAMPEITVAELWGERPLEISIEVPQENLRRYGMTLDQVAAAVRSASVELPGGGVKTGKGEILLRVAERRDIGREFEDIVVLARPDGTSVRLSDIADVRDGFSEVDREVRFNGQPAARIQVYRIGDQGPIDVSGAVHRFVADYEQALPPGVQVTTWEDRSEMYAGRVDLLRRNSILGLVLVIAVLGLFLNVRLAFWVTMGIPISFVGSLLFLPTMEVSINMISLFAFIVTLGMVVDDAIIVGEAIHKHRRDGMSLEHAAVAGVREVAGPVTFSILTTVIAFMPLLFVPGPAGKFFRNIPLVVIAVLAISLIESVLVLPAHLAEKKHFFTTVLGSPFVLINNASKRVLGFGIIDRIEARQERFGSGVEWFVEHVYGPVMEFAGRWRYLTIATAIGSLVLTFGLIGGGRVKSTFFPKIDGDVIGARLEMPVGTPVAETRKYQQRMLETAQVLLEEKSGDGQISRGVFAEIGGPGMRGATAGAREGSGASHTADVMVFMVDSADREISSSEFARLWRERVGEIPGAEKLSFKFSTGHSGGSPVHIRLSHPDSELLEATAEKLAAVVRDYEGTYEVSDGTARGKEQLDFRLRPEARSLGLDQLAVARQLRASFYGAEALRQQRGREEIRVFVRRPLAERASEAHVEDLMLRTADGGEVPLLAATELQRGHAYTTIRRAEGRRTVDVTAEVDEAVANAVEIQTGLLNDVLPKLAEQTPGLTYTLEGQGREQAEMMGGIRRGYVFALLAMFGLLAIAFKSYMQPLIVMSAIPFGIIGAVVGHVLLGINVSLMTMFGVVALSGVVVNDSLVLVDAVNRYRAGGLSVHDAAVKGAKRRFRPIILTSLTTFLGLMPMILETSMQARFLVPMAVSLGFGVLFGTIVILLLVPCLYLMLEDLARLFGGPGTTAEAEEDPFHDHEGEEDGDGESELALAPGQ